MNSDKPVFNITVLLVVACVSGILLLLQDNYYSSTWVAMGVVAMIIEVTALNTMIKSGTFIYSNFYRYLLICFSVYITGSLFKILHYPGGDEMIMLCLAAFALLYIVWTAGKKPVFAVDIAKCIWVLSFCTAAFFNIMRQPNADIVNIVNAIAFIILFILFLIYPAQRHKIQRQKKETLIDQI